MAQMKASDTLMVDCLKAPVVFDAGLVDSPHCLGKSKVSVVVFPVNVNVVFCQILLGLVFLMNIRGKVYHVEPNIQA